MTPIGGYFELELFSGKHYHAEALRLNTARRCFEYVLRVRKYHKIYIPYFICEVMLEPIRKLQVEYAFYSINEAFEPIFDKSLGMNEALLYINYFGLQQSTVVKLTKRHRNVIIDNAQSFYAESLAGVDTFYSARKFFGVPDGAYLYTGLRLPDDLLIDKSYDRMAHLLKRIDCSAEEGYADFKANDDSLMDNPICTMSKLTEALLRSIDYEQAKKKRIANYIFLTEFLNSNNRLSLLPLNGTVPMVYPFWSEDENLRSRLIKNKVFVATYWPNVFEWCNESQLEYLLAKDVLPLPIDQRYGEEDMRRIVDVIKSER
jgi:hypothetical protein